jgi:hypothetical protein
VQTDYIQGCHPNRIVTQIGEKEFILEGYSNKTKICSEFDENFPYKIELEGGPLIHTGLDFFGQGKVRNLQLIDSDKEDYIILKINLE